MYAAFKILQNSTGKKDYCTGLKFIMPIMVEIRENTEYCALNAICRQICKWHQTSLTPVFQKHIGDA